MKVVLITGATRNTGLAVAKRFAAEGYCVAVTSRDGAAARETAEALSQEYSVCARGYEMQPSQVQSIRKTFDRVRQDFGRLDAFVANCAHLGVGYSLLDSTEEEFDAVADVNIKGTFFCCQCAAWLMIESGGGAIVTVGSVQGTGGVHGRAVYGMSKAALSVLARYMAYELGQYHIRANNVVAGAVHSCRWDDLSDEEITARRSRYPVGRESTEEEIAGAVWFLASEQSASITGTDLTVDSGLTACLLPYTKKE